MMIARLFLMICLSLSTSAFAQTIQLDQNPVAHVALTPNDVGVLEYLKIQVGDQPGVYTHQYQLPVQIDTPLSAIGITRVTTGDKNYTLNFSVQGKDAAGQTVETQVLSLPFVIAGDVATQTKYLRLSWRVLGAPSDTVSPQELAVTVQ